MVVFGVDPGIAITGYGVVSENEDGKLFLVDYGVVRTSHKLSTPERLIELHQKLTEKLFLHHPASGAVEKLFFQKNIRTAMSVGHARGVALLALGQAGIPIAEYTPLEIKQAVTGYGGAEKNQVQQMVRTLLVMEKIPRPDDAADALAVAICHIHSSKYMSLSGSF
jgi:crossover junction endodeoxyribonuclease RuvC